MRPASDYCGPLLRVEMVGISALTKGNKLRHRVINALITMVDGRRHEFVSRGL